jgi:hypothetical protein
LHAALFLVKLKPVQLFENDTQIFVVRAWRERRENDAPPSDWRGVIVHVVSGEREYWTNIADVITFMSRYLQGIDPSTSAEPTAAR